MNFVFWIGIIIAAVFLWFCLSFAFKGIGGAALHLYAEANAEKVRIAADAEADANLKIARSLTGELIEKIKYERWKERCENDPENRHYRYLRDEFPQRLSWTDEEIYQCEIDGYEPDEIGDDGEVYSTYNPKSKWDWYVIGGRFSQLLQCKTGVLLRDQAYARDVDFYGMKAREEKSLIPYDEFISRNTYWKPEYLKEMYPDEHTYIAMRTCFSTYAVITPDGEWCAPGEMGWWAISSESPEERIEWDLKYYERFIAPAIKQNWYITIVDCHI